MLWTRCVNSGDTIREPERLMIYKRVFTIRFGRWHRTLMRSFDWKHWCVR